MSINTTSGLDSSIFLARWLASGKAPVHANPRALLMSCCKLSRNNLLSSNMAILISKQQILDCEGNTFLSIKQSPVQVILNVKTICTPSLTAEIMFTVPPISAARFFRVPIPFPFPILLQSKPWPSSLIISSTELFFCRILTAIFLHRNVLLHY